MKINVKSVSLYCFLFFFILVTLSACEINIADEGEKENDIFVKEDDVAIRPERGGQIRLFSTKVDTFNPLLSFNSYVKEYSKLMFDSLYEIDERQIARNSLVKSDELSEDGLVWTFNLRDDVRWHNGYPFSAKDVEFTLKILSRLDLDSIYKNNLDGIRSFSVVDDNTFKITTESKDTNLPWKLTFPILPWSYYIDQEGFEIDNKRPPIGTGYYRVLRYDMGERLILERNDNWWKALYDEDERPFLDRIEILFFDDHKKELTAFQNRQVDIAFLDKEMLEQFKNRRDVTFQKYTSNEFEFLTFNLKSDSFVKVDAVRRAIAKGIDRTQIINLLTRKDTSLDNLPIASESWLNDKFLPQFVASKDRARHVLFEEGFLFGDKYFFVIDEDGEERILEIELLVNMDNKKRVMICEDIKTQLEDIGIRVEIIAKERADYFNALTQKNYELAISGIALADYLDFESLYHSKENGLNLAGYESVKMDNLLLQFKETESLDKKRKISEDIRKLLSEDVPYIGLFFYNKALAYNREIFGNLEPRYWHKLNDIKSFAVERKE